MRNALLLEQVPNGPADRYLLPGPAVPVSVGAGDGTASFDGEHVHLEWNWMASDSKKSLNRVIAVADIASVQWQPSAGLENGYLRFVVPQAAAGVPPRHDMNAVELFGFKKDALMALVAAAVAARLPHPSAPGAQAAATAAPLPPAGAAPQKATPDEPGPDEPGPRDTPGRDDHDALLRRLRELGELHRSGILTEEEFITTKQAILRRF